MLSDVTSRPSASPQPGAQPGDWAQSGEAYGPTPPAVPGIPMVTGEPSTVPLAGGLSNERHRLPARVMRYWRWRAFFLSLPLFFLLIGAAILLPWGPWWVRWGIVGLSGVTIAACMFILPSIRYRVFWYAISPTEIDVQNGIVFLKRTIVPIHRVQDLRSVRGPLADHYAMMNLKIRTAGGSVGLNGLDRVEADELCQRISQLTDLTNDV